MKLTPPHEEGHADHVVLSVAGAHDPTQDSVGQQQTTAPVHEGPTRHGSRISRVQGFRDLRFAL